MSAINTDSFKASLAEIKGELDSINQEILDKEKERDDIKYASLCRDEVFSNVSAYINRIANGYTNGFTKRISPAFLGNFDANKTVHNIDLFKTLSSTGNSKQEVTEEALCYFFGDTIKNKLKSTIKDMDWPSAEGLPKDERAKLLKKIDVDIKKLNEKKQDLISDIEKSGMNITERYS